MATNGMPNGFVKTPLKCVNGGFVEMKRFIEDKQTGPNYSYEEVSALASLLSSKTKHKPEIGIVCGSGLGQVCDSIENADRVHYSEIPSFPVSTVHGHKGTFVFGKLGEKTVVAMQGRFHPYEGYNMKQCVLPIRIMYMMGVEIVLLTNAAGSLNESFRPGDLVMIKDHIFIPGMIGLSPLSGPNDERFGPRFLNTQNIYDKKLRLIALDVARKLDMRLCQGVYAMLGGPQYETPAECLMMKRIGADLVGK